MPDPHVSVIVPAYNAADTVGAAVDSVLNQTVPDFELVVVDDGSSDSTAEVVGTRPDPRLQCIRTANQGVSRARNVGIVRSRAQLVAFLDADDVWLPTKLERQLEVMATKPAAGLSFTAAELVDADLCLVGYDPAVNYEDFTDALLTIGNVVSGGGSAAMVRRSLLELAGPFDANFSQCADWELWLRLSVLSEICPISEPLVRYRKAPGSMSSDPALLEHDTFALLDKFYGTASSERYRHVKRRAYANHWMICAGTYLHAGRLADSVRCLRCGVRADPRSVRRPLLLPVRAISRTRRRRAEPRAPQSSAT